MIPSMNHAAASCLIGNTVILKVATCDLYYKCGCRMPYWVLFRPHHICIAYVSQKVATFLFFNNSLCCNGIWVSLEMGYFCLESCSELWHSEFFCHKLTVTDVVNLVWLSYVCQTDQLTIHYCLQHMCSPGLSEWTHSVSRPHVSEATKPGFSFFCV